MSSDSAEFNSSSTPASASGVSGVSGASTNSTLPVFCDTHAVQLLSWLVVLSSLTLMAVVALLCLHRPAPPPVNLAKSQWILIHREYL